MLVLIPANTARRGRVILQCGIVPYPFLENILESVPFKVILLVLPEEIELRIKLACNVLI
jgi:hypothetical protein